MEIKPASQQRSREKRDRIMAALNKLLLRKPFVEISVQEVARTARVSPATLYQRFSNQDVMGAVLLSLYYASVEAWAHRPRTLPAQGGQAPLQEVLWHLAADAWDMVAELGHVMRPAYLYSRQHPDRTGEHWPRLEQQALAGFRGLLTRYAQQLPDQDLDESAATLAMVFNTLLLAPLLHGEDRRWQAPRGREAFATMVAALTGRYLTAPR